MEKVISINRITKVTKGGKKLSFSALVVVGDGKGNVGYCLDKAPEVATAIQKSLRIAKKNMFKVIVRKGTISHEIIGRCGGATVLLKPASEGTGVIAAGPVRAICDASGIRNILTKCHRSNNPINVIKATVDGLNRLKPFKDQDKEEVKEAVPETAPEAAPEEATREATKDIGENPSATA
ncbi:MAG: 30S ribosomal protein S5 [Candidatus Aceula meridiana]|nr:30S ribosomal protein S5 [Candidatus Aceula meridiana]